ncbi:hypothetical protein LRC484719_09740 [Mycobacterium riyadhense]
MSVNRGVRAEVGVRFDCDFTGPKGAHYVAHMRVAEVNGERVEFDITTQPG